MLYGRNLNNFLKLLVLVAEKLNSNAWTLSKIYSTWSKLLQSLKQLT